VPIFKFCGHFVVIIGDYKYELGLDANSNRPFSRHKRLEPREMKALRYSFSHFWSIHGWTSEDHEAIASHFAEVVNQFGPYHLLYNNCRHFLYVSLRSLPPVLALPSDIVLLNPNPLMTLFSGLQSAMTLWRHVQRDLYRWIWKCMWGPGGCGACLD